MSACAAREMTNHHGLSLLSPVLDTFRTWARRYNERAELAALTDRDLNDVGLTRGDVALEIAKPFWRA